MSCSADVNFGALHKYINFSERNKSEKKNTQHNNTETVLKQYTPKNKTKQKKIKSNITTIQNKTYNKHELITRVMNKT